MTQERQSYHMAFILTDSPVIPADARYVLGILNKIKIIEFALNIDVNR